MSRLFFRVHYWMKFVRTLMACVFILSSTTSSWAQGLSLGAGAAVLPEPGTMLSPSKAYSLAVLRGVKVDVNDPLVMDFIVEEGNADLEGDAFESEGKKLIKYFLTALTVPEKELWVNLSPYEADRIIPEKFGQTEMGRDLLAQDYVLKQLAASLSNPDTELGREFWQRVYARAEREYGTTDIPADIFNKVWIVPDKAVVYENGNVAYIKENRLKVMLETDYEALRRSAEPHGAEAVPPQTERGLAREKAAGPQGPEAAGETVAPSSSAMDALTKKVMVEVIIPELTREVNEGRNFANLRQVYNSMLIAYWYKVKVRESILGETYLNKNKIAGAELEDKTVKEKIYQQYAEAFRKGAYNYIKEDVDATRHETIPRKYFSGGMVDYAAAPEAVHFVENNFQDLLPTVRRPARPDRAMRVRLDAAMNNGNNNSSVKPFVGNVPTAKGQIDLQRFRSQIKKAGDFVETTGFGEKVTKAFDTLQGLFPRLNVKNSLEFQQVVDGILTQRGFAIGFSDETSKLEIYVEQGLLELPGSEFLLERLGILALERFSLGTPGPKKYKKMFQFAKERLSPERFKELFPHDPDDQVAQAKAEYYLVGFDQESREAVLGPHWQSSTFIDDEDQKKIDAKIQEKVREKYNKRLGPGEVKKVDREKMIDLHYELLERATEAIYMEANAVLDGVVVNYFVDNLKDIAKVTAVNDNIIFDIEGSKWAPTTGFHRAVPHFILAETSGADHRRKRGEKIKKWAVINVANVTVKDGRKPSVWSSFFPRFELLEKLFKKAKGFLNILRQDPLYDDFNAEETTAVIMTKMLIDLLRSRGVEMPDIKTADDITPDLIRKINEEMEKLKAAGRGVNVTVNYQNGEDHNRVFQLTINPLPITQQQLKDAGLDPGDILGVAQAHGELFEWTPQGSVRLKDDFRTLEKDLVKVFGPVIIDRVLTLLKAAQEFLVKSVPWASGVAGLQEQRFWAALAWEEYKKLIIGQQVEGEAKIFTKEEGDRKQFYAAVVKAKSRKDLLDIFDEAIERYKSESKEKKRNPNYVVTMPFAPEIDSDGKLTIMRTLFPSFIDVIGCCAIRPNSGSVDTYRDKLILDRRLMIMPVPGVKLGIAASDARAGFIGYLVTGVQDPNLLGVLPDTTFEEITAEDWSFLLRSAGKKGEGTTLPVGMKTMLDWRQGEKDETRDKEQFKSRLGHFGEAQYEIMGTSSVVTIGKNGESGKSGAFQLKFSVLETFDDGGNPRSILQIENMSRGSLTQGQIDQILRLVQDFSGGTLPIMIHEIDFGKSFLSLGSAPEQGKPPFVTFVKPHEAKRVQIYRVPASWNELQKEISAEANGLWRAGSWDTLGNWQSATKIVISRYIPDPDSSKYKFGDPRDVDMGDSLTMKIDPISMDRDVIRTLSREETYLCVSVDYAQTFDEQPTRVSPEGGINLDMEDMDFRIESTGAGIQFNIDPAMLKNGNFDGLVPVILNITPVTNLPLFLGAKEPEHEGELAGVAS
jgi:hypothetical protein